MAAWATCPLTPAAPAPPRPRPHHKPISLSCLQQRPFAQSVEWTDLQAPAAGPAVFILNHQPAAGQQQRPKRANADTCPALVAQRFAKNHLKWFARRVHGLTPIKNLFISMSLLEKRDNTNRNLALSPSILLKIGSGLITSEENLINYRLYHHLSHATMCVHRPVIKYSAFD